MLNKKVFWYRNASEKDQGQPHGEGTLVHIELMERTAEGIGVIVDAEGNFHEKTLSLVRVDMTKPIVNKKPIPIKK